MTELEKFFSKQPAASSPERVKLPMYHSCTFTEILDYLRNNKILLSECDVFKGEKFIYIFLGKARYIREIPNKSLAHVPFCFVFKPDALLNIFRVYPFDTGAVKLDRYQPIITKEEIEEVKQKYLLGTNLATAYNLIDFFYTDQNEYIRENIKNHTEQDIQTICIENSVLQLEKLNAIYKSIHGRMDGRRNTIEVHVNKEIDLLDDHISHLLLPTNDYEKNEDILIYLQRKNNVKPLFYAETMPYYYDQYYSLLLNQSIQLANSHVN